MSADRKAKQPKSRSLIKTTSRLVVTRRHLETVDEALRQAKSTHNKAITNHALTRNNELALQLLYTHINEYLKSILSEMFEKRPLVIVDKSQENLQFQEIIRLGTYEAICEHMIDRVFRRLQNDSRSTLRLIEKILAKTNAKIDETILADAMWYIEIRHLIVHNASLIDKKFEEHYSHKLQNIKAGNKLPISLGMAKDGIKAVTKLCQTIDNELVTGGYINIKEFKKSAIGFLDNEITVTDVQVSLISENPA